MAEQPEQSAPVVEVNSLSYSYAKTIALKQVNFKVTRRSIHGFVGPNGAGKTTTLKILATLLMPHRGNVRVFGHDIRREPKPVRRRIGFMPDHFNLYPQMTVNECLDFFAAAYGLSAAERARTIDDVLALTDMQGRKDALIKGLSRGMMQRVSLARALVHDPDLLLLDEPAAGLDPRARIELIEILRALSGMGKTVFISSHILSELANLCDSVTIIDRGVVKFSGPMADLLTARTEHVAYVLTLAADSQPTEEALKKLDGVVEVKKAEDKPSYRVVFDKQNTDANALVRVVLESGGRLVSFQEDVRELSEAFMELTEPGVP